MTSLAYLAVAAAALAVIVPSPPVELKVEDENTLRVTGAQLEQIYQAGQSSVFDRLDIKGCVQGKPL